MCLNKNKIADNSSYVRLSTDDINTYKQQNQSSFFLAVLILKIE